eukprot:SAG11_NODE_1529_length_4738_cov_1.628799_5_plen_45_part_00
MLQKSKADASGADASADASAKAEWHHLPMEFTIVLMYSSYTPIC